MNKDNVFSVFKTALCGLTAATVAICCIAANYVVGFEYSDKNKKVDLHPANDITGEGSNKDIIDEDATE